MTEQKAQEATGVTKDMTLADIIEKFPEAAEVMQSYGLHCIGCHVNVYETLEQGALGHGMDEDVIESMVKEINEVVAKGGGKTAVKADVSVGEVGKEPAIGLELTDNAAKKIIEIRGQQNKDDCALRIGVVAGGCAGYTYNMDFEKTPNDDDIVAEIKGVKIFMDKKSAELLRGSAIDFVESLQGAGFKFNNPNAHSSCGCGKSFA